MAESLNGTWSPLAECWTNGSIPGSLDRTAEVIDKDFSVSYLMTAKNIYHTYQLRHDIWAIKDQIIIPKNFWNSNRDPIDNTEPKLKTTKNFLSDKIVLYKSMFNICPENFIGDEENFSQRLIDCFINRTIPIYRGYDDIGKHFNLDGMIIINSAIEALHKICPEAPV